jgi:hypothetical protein
MRFHALGLPRYCLWRKYARWYIRLMRSKTYDIECYTEKHHIFPVSIFGRNKRVVQLTGRQHFIAHKLLAKIYLYRCGQNSSKYSKMQKACTIMMAKTDVRRSSRRFEFCRKMAAEASIGRLHTVESREKMRKIRFANNHRKGTKRSEETLTKLKKSLINVKISNETRAKMLISLRANPPMLGKKHSTETRALLSEMRKGKKLCREQVEKSAKARCKTIATPDGIFDSQRAAAKHYGITPSSICGRLKTESKHYYYL